MTFEEWWMQNNQEHKNKGFTTKGISRLAWDAGKNLYHPEPKTIHTMENFPEDTDCCSSGK